MFVSLRKLLVQVMGDMNRSNTMVLAAGVSYFAALAFFPTFAAALAIASVVVTPDQVASVVEAINVYLPKDIASLISIQLDTQTNGGQGGNIAVALAAIGISLFGASAAIENTLRSLNVAYGLIESRNPVKLRMLSVWILLSAIPFAAVVMVLLVIGDYMIGWGVPSGLVVAVELLRWPLLVIMVSCLVAILYRYGPSHRSSEWRWASPGVMVATALWTCVTVGFFVYMRLFPSFGNSYTVAAGIVVLMIWINVSVLALLVGAHVNARLEKKNT